AGLDLEASQPVMTCSPAGFQPYQAPAVDVCLLVEADAAEQLAAYLEAAPLCFGGETKAATAEEINRFRDEIASGRLRYGQAELNGHLAGIACSMPTSEVAE